MRVHAKAIRFDLRCGIVIEFKSSYQNCIGSVNLCKRKSTASFTTH